MTTSRGGMLGPSLRRCELAVLVIALAVVVLGCTSTAKEDVDRSSTTQSSEVGTPDTVIRDGMTDVAALAIALDLPPSFEVATDPDLMLLARSLSPRAILSISRESSSIVDHEAEPGETVDRLTIGGRDAVVVSNANVDGLPRGITANELLVDNGRDSFSLILSSDAETLGRLWQPMIESIRFQT